MILSWIFNSLAATMASPSIVTAVILGGPSLVGSGLGIIGAFAIGGWVIGIIIAIAVLISYVKLFSKLLVSFISIIVSLVLGPLILLGNALPGSNTIGTWFRGIVANVSVFPITMILMLFSYILMVQPLVGTCPTDWTQIDEQTAGGSLGKWGNGSVCEIFFGVRRLTEPGYVNSFPLITPILGEVKGGFDPDALLALVGVMLLLMASKYVDIVKDALKVPPFKYGADIMSALKMGFKATPNVPGIGTTASMTPAYRGIKWASDKLTKLNPPQTSSVNQTGQSASEEADSLG
jgi:hypothetical protein